MKKNLIAKIAGMFGNWTLSFGVGYAWGTLLKNTIGKWFLDEENMDAHPKTTFWLAILYIVLLMAMPIVWAFGPAIWIGNKINDFIDEHFPVEDEWGDKE